MGKKTKILAMVVLGILLVGLCSITLAASENTKLEENKDFESLKNFLEKDNISEREFDATGYDCRMFVRDLKENLEDNRFDVSVVSITLERDNQYYGHTCLHWKDNIFIESITDKIFELEENKPYKGYDSQAYTVIDFVIF